MMGGYLIVGRIYVLPEEDIETIETIGRNGIIAKQTTNKKR